MKLKPLVAALALMAVASAASAITTLNAGSYSLTYDETTTFGSLSSWFESGDSRGFTWSFSPSVFVTGASSPTVVALPSFTLTSNPGYTLSGDFTAFMGNLVYNELGGTSSISTYADLSVDGVALAPINGMISKTPTVTLPGFSAGYYADTSTYSLGTFSTLSVSNAQLVLSAVSATIIAQPQNKLEFSFVTTPVPEPETYAMFLAGIGLMGAIARRRKLSDKSA